MGAHPIDADPCARIRPAASTDRAVVDAMLTRLNLPLAGVAEWFHRFWVAEHSSGVVGVAGIELYGDAALLRSVAVLPEWRGSGVGRALVEQVLEAARESGARDIYLLTTTAEHYFPRFGFACITREQVPNALNESVEFRSACPASALTMHMRL